ncbi:hypothetical protein K7X08_033742 [Anisodus acutangulus]|uniref:Uncharacterized protein n=1 Tax=Anisodus acutangulus TaxID=402998 RepID=A0A9Q1RAE1_9SOLA|nr:hypothetical protein K7X08_033742 [Anisodus acutangulus]
MGIRPEAKKKIKLQESSRLAVLSYPSRFLQEHLVTSKIEISGFSSRRLKLLESFETVGATPSLIKKTSRRSGA